MNEIIGNLDSLRTAMDDSEFDAIIAMSPENVPYTSGVGIWSQKVIRDRLALVVWPKDGEPTLIVATNEEGYVTEKSWITDVRAYSQHAESPIKLLSLVLQEKGLGAARIGFEPAYLTTDYYLELLDTMPEASIRFALSNPGVSTVLVGYSNMGHLERSVKYASKGPLAREALNRLPEIWSTFVS